MIRTTRSLVDERNLIFVRQLTLKKDSGDTYCTKVRWTIDLLHECEMFVQTNTLAILRDAGTTIPTVKCL